MWELAIRNFSRPAILALIIFFVLGAFFLLRLDPRRGIEEAGNAVPVTV